jgi:hypothetical protein
VKSSPVATPPSVLSEANLLRARQLAEGRGDDPHAAICRSDRDVA